MGDQSIKKWFSSTSMRTQYHTLALSASGEGAISSPRRQGDYSGDVHSG